MREVAGPGASPAFTRMAKGLCVAPPPMEGGAIGARWGARWGDGGRALGRAWASFAMPSTEVAGSL